MINSLKNPNRQQSQAIRVATPAVITLTAFSFAGCAPSRADAEVEQSSAEMQAVQSGFDALIQANAMRMLEEGKQTFRFNTFGSEDFWGGTLRLHEVIAGTGLGGVGAGVSPKMALELGLKVDAEALPTELVAQIQAGTVDLNDPATTIALLKLNAVVGVTGFFDADGNLRSLGIQCAICHSTVDDSFSPGIGKRLDGWGNRDLDIGAFVASAPNLEPFSDLLGVDIATVKAVLNSWAPDDTTPS